LSDAQTWRARRTHFMHRVHARRAVRAKPATGFVLQPEPRSIGLFARGRQLIAGNFLFGGRLTEAPEASIWDIEAGNAFVAAELQSCAWLDDLAAVGDGRARTRAQAWIFDWIDRYGGAKGEGWTPELAGRRLIRWINHSIFLLQGREADDSRKFFGSLGAQTIFLARRWKTTPAGLARFEATCGLIYAGFALEGMEEHVQPAMAALAHDCRTQIDTDGGIATRNPEELLEVFTLLSWAVLAMTQAGKPVPTEVTDAIERIAPTLRSLRHADGGLARYHGGGKGLEGRLDHALAASEVKTQPSEGLHMGFARVTAGRTSIIVDASPPPSGLASVNGHASTLAFELTSGRRPLIVNCGSGQSFGDEWRRAGRATPSHSTLGIDGYSSARLGQPSRLIGSKQELLVDAPDHVHYGRSEIEGGIRLELSHNGFQPTHGLTHGRAMDIDEDGRGVIGEDVLTTLSKDDEVRFDRALDLTSLQGIPYTLRFHLHPDVDAKLDMGGKAVSMALKSGEIWVFRTEERLGLTLERSVFLENGRLKPRGTQQVVLSGRTMSYATRVRWSLAKAQDTPDVVRDLVRSDPVAVDE